MPEKLTITAYKDYNYSASTGQFEVLINPEKYDTSQEVKYDDKQAIGTPAAEPRFMGVPSEECKLTLLFDSTGLVPSTPASLKGKTLAQQIDAFLEVTSDFKGDIHRPPPLELVWGSFTFKGVLSDLQITYNIFKPDGTPVRAQAEASFKTASETQEALLNARKSSPDLTHIKTLKAGESIPQLCYEIYNGENYFVQVAQANRLNHLRGHKVGQVLNFPPLQQK